MVKKIGKVIATVVLSFVFLIVASMIIDWIAGIIFGKKSSGSADFNGGVLFVVTLALTAVFSVWFYKYVSIKKKNGGIDVNQ